MLGFRRSDKHTGMLAGMKHCLPLACLLFMLGCGDNDDGGDTTPIDSAAVDTAIDSPATDGPVVDAPIDGPPPIDAPSSVQVIPDCTGIANPAVTVSAATGAYSPQNPTLQAGQVLRFEPGSPIHDMDADNGEFGTTPGQITCLRFTAAGSFPVHCSIHFFSGTITVQ